MPDYSSLAGPGLSFAGVDQGIDFTGAGDLFTPYAAVVTRVQPSGSGWPGQGAVINLQFIEGPAKGAHVYYAEDLVPAGGIKPGKKIPAGATVARATGSGQAPGVEIGWAQPSGIPAAPRPAPRPANQYTAQGANFDSFVQLTSKAKSTGGGGGQGGLIGSELNKIGLPSWLVGGSGSGNAAASILNVPSQATGGAIPSVTGATFLGKITDPSYILRGLQILGGAALAGTGVLLLAKQVGLAPDAPLPGPAAGVARAGEVG